MYWCPSFDLGDRTPADEVMTCDLLEAVFNWPFRVSGVARQTCQKVETKAPSFSLLKRTAVRP